MDLQITSYEITVTFANMAASFFQKNLVALNL